MGNTKIVFFSILSSTIVFAILIIWHYNSPIIPLILSLQLLPAEIPSEHPRVYSRIDNNFTHLGYNKVVYTRSGYNSAGKNSVLVVSSIANQNSFGKDRGFEDFYKVIGSLEYPTSSINIAFYCGSLQLYNDATNYLEAIIKGELCTYNQMTILYAPFLQSDFKSSEHSPKLQRLRRRNIAQGRNFALFNSLQSEHYTLFLDADVIRFDHTNMLKRFVNSGKDIIVPRIELGGEVDYDKNSWRGNRKTPSASQLQLMNDDKWDEAGYVPEDVKDEIFHLGDHARSSDMSSTDSNLDLSYTVKLDSVGGAVLFLKSIIFKQGVVFPTMNIVGTSWQRKEGYDGIETEGVCYMAQTLGYTCFAMPNLVAQHALI